MKKFKMFLNRQYTACTILTSNMRAITVRLGTDIDIRVISVDVGVITHGDVGVIHVGIGATDVDARVSTRVSTRVSIDRR